MQGMVTRLFFDAALLPGGWADDVRVTLDGPRIARVESGAAPAASDERHAIGLPGLANLHSHAFQRGMAGLAERRGAEADSFWTWRETMYRFLGAMTPDDVEAVAAQAYAEMLEGGFTRVGEFHYLHHDRDGTPYADPAELAGRIVGAARETGIGLTLLPVLYARGGFGGRAAEPGQRRFVNDLDGFARLHEGCRDHAADDPGIVVGVAPHSLRAVTPEELNWVARLDPAGPIHIHVAEQTREVEDCLAWSGRRPVEWLLDHAPVDRRWTLVHATHVTPEETSRMAATGAVAGLCPVTEANLGDGIFPGAAYLRAGGAIGVGSDSNVLIDAAGELRQLEYSQRLALRVRNAMAPAGGGSTGGALLDACLAGGARSLGVPPPGLREDATADLVSLRRDAALAGHAGDAIVDGWIFAAARSPIDRVWSGGRCVVRDGRHVRTAAIAARYRAVMKELTAR